ncbi:MAG: hypothetical protein H7A46_09180 [Verrucomicrobiales bacterium]|nr:hypothetical protein [Verrucomicrobiales bacterium]
MRGSIGSPPAAALRPSFHPFCGICRKVLKPVLHATIGKLGCTGGIAAFEGACNLALDPETLGAGAVVCTGGGVVLGALCAKYGADWITQNVDHVVDQLCNKLC